MAVVASTPLTAMPYENQRRNSTNKIDNVELGELEIKPAVGQADAAADYSGFTKKTDPLEIKLVRKLDMFIMPSLWSMYWLNYLDRNAIALAKLSTIEMDLGITDVQYQTAVSILFAGYVIFGVPSNMVLTRVNPPLYLCCIMVTWSILSICTAFTKNATHLYLTRFFLGVCEAPYYPGALLIISNFYTRTEVAARIAILYTGNILATAFAGLISIGIFKLDGQRGYAAWQWLFIIASSATGLVAIMAYPFLPSRPLTTRWLKPEERQLAHDRLIRDKIDEKPPGSTWSGFKQAIGDYRTWIFAFMFNNHLAANGFKNFFPSVTLGFDQTMTLVLTCPPYLAAGVVTLCVSLSSGHFNERTWHITISKCVAIIGFVIAPATLNTGVRYFAMCVFTMGTYGVNSLILGWASTVLSQTQEKKAVVIAILTSCANASFIYTPYLFRDADKPRYALAMGFMAAFSLLTLLSAWVMKLVLKRQNRTIGDSGAATKYPY